MSQRFGVLIAPEAERDIEEIYRYIAEHDGTRNAYRRGSSKYRKSGGL